MPLSDAATHRCTKAVQTVAYLRLHTMFGRGNPGADLRTYEPQERDVKIPRVIGNGSAGGDQMIDAAGQQ